MSKAPQEIKLTEQRESQEDYPPVYFTSIELENVLCFKTRQLLDLSDSSGFPAQWTVILGDNGAGKTTLLRCLAAMEPIYHAWEDVEIIALPRLFYSNFRQMDHLLSKNTEISAHFMYGSSLIDRDIYTLHYSPDRPSEFHKASVSNTKDYIFKRDFFSARKFTASGGEKELLGFKCYGYGANRKMGETFFADSLSSERFASLFLDDFTLINAEEGYQLKTGQLVG